MVLAGFVADAFLDFEECSVQAKLLTPFMVVEQVAPEQLLLTLTPTTQLVDHGTSSSITHLQSVPNLNPTVQNPKRDPDQDQWKYLS